MIFYRMKGKKMPKIEIPHYEWKLGDWAYSEKCNLSFQVIFMEEDQLYQSRLSSYTKNTCLPCKKPEVIK
jgi:hypothetical protein